MANRVRIVPLIQAHADDRRTIFEALVDSGVMVRESVHVVHQAITLGDHFHRRLTEHFVLALGKATLMIQEVNAVGLGVGEVETTEIVAPTVVVVPLLVAHRFTFNGPAILVCLANRRYEQDDAISFRFPS